MKKKRANSEKGKGMKFPFVRSPSFRIGKNEEFGFESASPILRCARAYPLTRSFSSRNYVSSQESSVRWPSGADCLQSSRPIGFHSDTSHAPRGQN